MMRDVLLTVTKVAFLDLIVMTGAMQTPLDHASPFPSVVTTRRGA